MHDITNISDNSRNATMVEQLSRLQSEAVDGLCSRLRFAGNSTRLSNNSLKGSELGLTASQPRADQSAADTAAPDSKLMRGLYVTGQGLLHTPEGIKNAAIEDIKNWQGTLKMIGVSAGFGAALKLALPETGPVGAVIGTAIGAYFLTQSARPFVDSYQRAMDAKTMGDLNACGVQWGDAAGSFVTNSAIGMYSSKIGAGLMGRALMTEPMDGFANFKASTYAKLDGRLSGLLGEETAAASGSLSARRANTADGRVTMLDSETPAPKGAQPAGNTDPNAELELSVMLKSKAADLTMERTIQRISAGMQEPLSDAQFAEKFGSDEASLSELSKFAESNGLQVTEPDLAAGRVMLKGTAQQFMDAFKVKLTDYQDAESGQITHAYNGALSVPAELSPHLEGILGLDEAPKAKALVVQPVPPDHGPIHYRLANYMPNEVADAYDFPKGLTGKGQNVAIIELGGGLDPADNAVYYSKNNLPQPKIDLITVDGAKSTVSEYWAKLGENAWDSEDPKVLNELMSDTEVAMDSQIVGAVAPDASQKIIFAPNSDQGFVDSILRATFPKEGEAPSSAISISWGDSESNWSQQGIRNMDLSFKKAAIKGISTFAATGDNGALDQSVDGSLQADFPASDPYVTGTGGTRLQVRYDGKITEQPWNDGKELGSTGGGISQKFPVPDYQKDLNMPANANTEESGRGVPDVVGNGDPVTGYKIRVGGIDDSNAGTSAVAPLFAGLAARINEGLGRRVGFLNPHLYAHASELFNDLELGNNNGYYASKGWDPVAGLGSIKGQALLDSLSNARNLPNQILGLVS
jgi:kumamolisin